MRDREEFIFAKISHIGYGNQKEFKEGVVSKIVEGWEVSVLISPTNTIKKKNSYKSMKICQG